MAQLPITPNCAAWLTGRMLPRPFDPPGGTLSSAFWGTARRAGRRWERPGDARSTPLAQSPTFGGRSAGHVPLYPDPEPDIPLHTTCRTTIPQGVPRPRVQRHPSGSLNPPAALGAVIGPREGERADEERDGEEPPRGHGH